MAYILFLRVILLTPAQTSQLHPPSSSVFTPPWFPHYSGDVVHTLRLKYKAKQVSGFLWHVSTNQTSVFLLEGQVKDSLKLWPGGVESPSNSAIVGHTHVLSFHCRNLGWLTLPFHVQHKYVTGCSLFEY
jgi:hypothetical protein